MFRLKLLIKLNKVRHVDTLRQAFLQIVIVDVVEDCNGVQAQADRRKALEQTSIWKYAFDLVVLHVILFAITHTAHACARIVRRYLFLVGLLLPFFLAFFLHACAWCVRHWQSVAVLK